MNFTDRQTTLLTVAITNFYDEIAKTSTPKMKEEVMELAKLVQDYGTENHK